MKKWGFKFDAITIMLFVWSITFIVLGLLGYGPQWRFEYKTYTPAPPPQSFGAVRDIIK